MLKVRVGNQPAGISPASQGLNTSMALGCVALFLLPFAGVGVFAAAQAVRRALSGIWHEALFFSLFALVFGGVGLGGLGLLWVGRGKLKEQEALKARHPDKPWLWQPDWVSGRIEDANRGTLWMSWCFSVFWNLVSFPVGFLASREALSKGNSAGYLALLFPLVGVGLLAWAIKTTIRYRKYGFSRLELATVPGVIGHTIAGTVRIGTVLESSDGFEATLTCVRRVTTKSGDDSSTSESILWQEECRIRGEPSRDAAGLTTKIPVAFHLPKDVLPCDSTDPNNRVLWRLRVAASVPGVDYDATFEVPVFRTEASERPLSDDEQRVTRGQLSLDDYRQPADSRIAVNKNRRGTEIMFPAGRNPGAATGGTLFTLIWLAIVWGLTHFKAPLIFPIVFGLFGVLLVYVMLEIWLGVSRVTMDAGFVTVASGYLSPGTERRISASEVAEVSTAIGMQAGTTPYYDIVIRRMDGKKVIAGRAVRNKREAEWLAAMIRKELGAGSQERKAG
jgi:hypothetical protein